MAGVWLESSFHPQHAAVCLAATCPTKPVWVTVMFVLYTAFARIPPVGLEGPPPLELAGGAAPELGRARQVTMPMGGRQPPSEGSPASTHPSGV